MRVFIDNTGTVEFGTQFLRARCFATPLLFLCFSMVHFMQVIGRGREAFLLAVVRQLVFTLPLLFLMNRLVDMTGIIWTQARADLCTVIVSYAVYARIRKKERMPPGYDGIFIAPAQSPGRGGQGAATAPHPPSGSAVRISIIICAQRTKPLTKRSRSLSTQRSEEVFYLSASSILKYTGRSPSLQQETAVYGSRIQSP